MSLTATDDRETWPTRLRRRFYGLRTEGAGAEREAVAIGVGVFIGCLPFYGFHLLLCWAVGTVFRLNRLKIYLAANISNPFVAPWLILTELQAGSLLRHGSWRAVSPHAIRTAGLGTLGVDLLVGSIAVGGLLAVVIGVATYSTLRGSAGDAGFSELVRRASDRYANTSITAWEFARGKLRGDPVYRATVCSPLLPSGGTLLDVGCGLGLTLAILAEAGRAADEGWWSSPPLVPPRFDRMIGVEIRARIAGLAREALNGDAEVVHADARELTTVKPRAVLLFDVLHLLAGPEQEEMLTHLASALEPGGVMLVRDADASAGWKFHAVRFGNRAKAIAFGAWRQQFCFRTRGEWLECFGRHGFKAEVQPMGEGTPFGNVLFRLTVRPAGSGSMSPREPPA